MLTNRIQIFLDELFIKYVLHANVTNVKSLNFSSFARSISACPIKAVLFADKQGPIIAAFDAEQGLDFNAVSAATDRELSLDPGRNCKQQLHGFSIRHLPPLGRLYQIPMLVDVGLLEKERYLIEVDKGECFIEIDQQGFKKLFQGAAKKEFTKSTSARQIPVKETSAEGSATNKKVETMRDKSKTLLTMDEVRARFEKGVELPVMPSVADQLIKLKARDSFELVDLVFLIESDPVVSAKIISYANSPFFSYEGDLATVQEAVYHVLGVDISLNISLALALGQQFQGTKKGPIGANAVWRQAVYCGVLSQSIASKIKNRPGLKAGTAYLFGLLHNVGYLAIGHLYKEEFHTFNKFVLAKKEILLEKLERKLLGVTHTEVGALLMQAWKMPDAYEVVMKHHHCANYSGDFEEYVNIVFMANQLLKDAGIGDAPEGEIPAELLKKYDLDIVELMNMSDIVMGWHENLDHLAHQLVA